MTAVGGAVDAGLTDPLWVPIAEAARQHSVSRAAMHKRVGKLVELGRLATRDGPRGTKLVNIAALDRAIASETDPAQALRNGAAPDEPELPEADEGVGTPPPPSSGGQSYHASRSNREAYLAEFARLDLDERLKRLCFVEDVDRRTMTAMRKIRDRFLALPAIIADRLAAAPDARAVRSILTNEVRSVLDALATDLDGFEDEDDAAADEPAPGEREPDQG